MDEAEDEYADEDESDDGDYDGDALHAALPAQLIRLKRNMKARRSKLRWWMTRSRSTRGTKNAKRKSGRKNKGGRRSGLEPRKQCIERP